MPSRERRSRTIPRPSITDRSTASHLGVGASLDGTAGRIDITVAPEQLPREIQALLRTRLRFIGLGITAEYMAENLLSLLSGSELFAGYWLWIARQWTVTFAVAVLTLWLWTKSDFSMRRLRALEIALFGLVLTDITWALCDELFFQRRLRPFVQSGAFQTLSSDVVWNYLSSWLLLFFVLIVGYGILIPSTWRRCTTMVATLALIPIALFVVGGLWEGAALVGPLGILSTLMVVWMAIASSIAIYGAHRIDALRRQALEARRLGQYQLKELLGAGGMGEVYLADHLLLRRPCAIKVIRPERAGDSTNLLRFEREARATAGLTHPNTVQIFDYGHTADGIFYYVMEYLPGLTLEQLVDRYGPLPPGRAVHFLRQVCGALREAHAIGLIHRDIKPGNIIICKRGGRNDVGKLVDFGLVLPQSLQENGQRFTREGVVTGTPAYMSPEQVGAEALLDARSDIYCVGAVALLSSDGSVALRRPIADADAGGSYV